MKGNQALVWLAAILITGLLCSCVSNRISVGPWMKNGQRIGTVETWKEPWGTQTDYKNPAGRLMRTERRNFDGRLLAGVCTVQFSYNPAGALTMEQDMNSDGQLASNPEGYAIAQYVYSVDLDGNPVTQESFFNENMQPVLTQSGFAVMKSTLTGNNQVGKIQFFDTFGKPAPSTWLGISDTVEVQYAYLEGVTPIVCAAFLDASGNVIERKQLSGLAMAGSDYSETTFWVPPPSQHYH